MRSGDGSVWATKAGKDGYPNESLPKEIGVRKIEERMTGEDDKSYPLESGENAEPATPPSLPEVEPDIVVSRGVEAFPLEEVDLESLDLPDHSGEPQETQQFELEIEPKSDYVKSLDVCPNCGKAMRKTRNLTCLQSRLALQTRK